jgi:uncharacterized iron-regulated membrane protein
MPDERPKHRWDFVGILALLLVLLLLVGGWLLFPRLHNEMMWQDCVASGRTNC